MSEKNFLKDKKEIAMEIRKAGAEDNLRCSLIENNIIIGCSSCTLKEICESIDYVVEEEKERHEKVIKTFDY